MPGFAGIIGGSAFNEGRKAAVERMVRCLAHEPGHAFDSINEQSLGVNFGWVRDGESGGAVQAWNAARDISLVFVGEEFSGNGDQGKAARLLRLYEQNGAGFIEDLNGGFSGLLIDKREDKIVLFNDRYGLSRIYYHTSPEGFFFASEAKSLLAVLPRLRRLDRRALAEFLAVGCVLQNRSLFQDVSLSPGGLIWTFHRDGRIEKRRYFDPVTWEQQEALDPLTYGERLREVFARVAPRYLRGDQPVGMSLTGGLDSRMILAFAQAAPGSLPCYTFGGPYRDCADVRIARQLASIARQSHRTIRIEEDFFRDFPMLAEKTIYYSDGAMDVSGAVELYVNRQAREIAPIRLTGNYGSEILRSNIAFGPGRFDSSLFTPEFVSLIQEAANTYRHEAMGHRLSFIAFKQVAWHHFARLSVEKSQLTLRSPFLDNELVALAYQIPPELAISPHPSLQLIAEGNPALGLVGTDRALRLGSRPVLTKVVQAWQEFTAKAEYAYDYGMPRWVARTDHFLSPLSLERFFLGHHKFYHFRIWYKKQLKGYLELLGLDAAANEPSCYRPGACKELIEAHLSGQRNHTLALHKMLTVQLIERLLIRQS